MPPELQPDGLTISTPLDQIQRTTSTAVPNTPTLRNLDASDKDIAIGVLRDILPDSQLSIPFGPFGQRTYDLFRQGTDIIGHAGVPSALNTDIPTVMSDQGWGSHQKQLYKALRPEPSTYEQIVQWGPDALGTVAGFISVATPAYWALLGVAGITAAGACYFNIGSCAAFTAVLVSVLVPGPLGRLARGFGVALEHFISDLANATVNAGQAYLNGGGWSVAGTALAVGIVLAAAGPFANFAKTGVCRLDRAVCYDALKFPETAAAYAAADGHRPARLFTVDREGSTARRLAALAGTPTLPGFDRDEYPFAVTRQGGAGAIINYVSPSENRSAGAFLGSQLKNLNDGQRFLLLITDGQSVVYRKRDAIGLASIDGLQREAASEPG